MFRLSLLIVTLFVASPTVLGQEEFRYARKLRELVQPYLDHHVFQAASVGVILNGKTWATNYGSFSNSDVKGPDADTLYEIGSVTKVFTSLLLADAIIRNEISGQDAIIADVSPLLAEKNAELARKITLRQLSQHTSGMPRVPSNLSPDDLLDPFLGYDRTRLYDFFATASLDNPPGKKHEYSNVGYALLGEVLVEKTGADSYEDLLNERILVPLDMTQTVAHWDDALKDKHAPPLNSMLNPDRFWNFDSFAGAGAIRSSANEMLKFLEANLEPPNTELGKSIELAWKESLPARSDHRAMGLGWMIAGDGQTRWHNGQTGGFHSMILVNRKLNAGLVFLCNTATSDADQLAESMFQTIVGMDVAPRTFEEDAIDPKLLERLSGNYELAPNFVMNVSVVNNRLMVQLTGQQALRVYRESDAVWNYREVEAQLRFDLPETGSATKVTLHQNGRVLPAPRINASDSTDGPK